MPYSLVSSTPLYHGRVFNVLQDEIQLPDGTTSQVDVIEHNGGVGLIALDDQQRVLLVRQYRHPARTELLEIPAGTLKKGEPPVECALRELREETGMGAGNLVPLGNFFLAPGYSTEKMHIFLATDLYPDPLAGDPDEFISVEKVHFREALRMIQEGMISDGKSLAAFLLATSHPGLA